SKRGLRLDDLADDPRLSALGFKLGEAIYEPKGCERCGGTGYRGRVGVFEVLKIDESVRGLINAQTDGNAVDRAAVEAGMTTMVDDGVAKCRAGITSAREVLRVTTIRGGNAEFPLSRDPREWRGGKRIFVGPDRGRGCPPHRVSRPDADRDGR